MENKCLLLGCLCSVFLQLIAQRFLCAINLFVSFFQNVLCHVQCCVLGDCIYSYERALSFLGKATLCITVWFCLVYEVEGWGSCHWWTVFQGDTKVKKAWTLNIVWSGVLGWLWLNCRTQNLIFSLSGAFIIIKSLHIVRDFLGKDSTLYCKQFWLIQQSKLKNINIFYGISCFSF